MIKNTAIFLAALSGLSGIAHAESVEARDPSSVVRALQAGGYKAILTKDSTGDPKIESASSGAKFIINFYGCTNNKDCRTLTFYAGWNSSTTSMSQMNDWNKNKRFSRGYIDKDGDPVMEFDLDLDDGGMSEALFIDNVEFWELSMGNFKKHIGS
jgi:Putative bacterial sensory transduction regulator